MDGAGIHDLSGKAGGAKGPIFTSRAQREAYRMRLLPAVMAEPPIRIAGLVPLVSEAALGTDAVAEAASLLLTAGRRPPVYVSANVPGGFESNLEPEKHYAGRIRHTAS